MFGPLLLASSGLPLDVDGARPHLRDRHHLMEKAVKVGRAAAERGAR